jgi:MFS family permease
MSEAAYGPGFNPDMMVTIFFITYTIFSFPTSHFIERYGLRAGVVVGAWLQAIGTLFRCFSFNGGAISNTAMSVIGQIIASLGQAFFVNPPPLIASTWFNDEERATATSIACNSNSLGIAFAYVLSPAIATNISNVNALAQTVALISICLAFIVTFCFEERPPLPPSYSSLMRVLDFETNTLTARQTHHQMLHDHSLRRQKALQRFISNGDASAQPTEPQSEADIEVELSMELPSKTSSWDTIVKTWSATVDLFHQSGFMHTLFAFAVAEAVINAFSTFMPDMLMPSGYSNAFASWMGFTFIISAMAGSAVASYIADRYKAFQSLMNVCFAASLGSVVFFNVLIINQSDSTTTTALIVTATILCGLWVGPLMPIGVEVAAECTYPAAETFSTGVMQVAGNLFSAILVPIMNSMKDSATRGMYKSNWVLVALTALGGVVFSRFSGTYRRLEAELQDASQRGGAGGSDAAIKLAELRSSSTRDDEQD